MNPPPDAAGFVRRPVIVSQLGPETDARLAAHPSRPIVRALGADETPWALREPADVLIARPFVKPWDAPPRERPAGWPGPLQWVFTVSAGVDFYPGWLLSAPVVTCGRGVTANPIAEYAMAAILSHAKRLEAIAVRKPEDFRITELTGIEGQTLGLAGFGAIGQATALRARAFGMRVLALKRASWGEAHEGVEPVADIGELLARSDHVVLALPATPATRHIVGAAALARAKAGLHIVNVARGSLIDQEALLAALDGGKIAAATLDVTEPEPLPAGHPLYTHPKVRLTPHSSWGSSANGRRLVEKLIANLDRYARGAVLADIVDPERGY
jgi:phosphoglycerate dehydrogenase-like enzyme